MRAFAYAEPRTLDAAVRELAEGGRLLAGGTDLLVQLRRQRTAAGRVVNLKRIPGLHDIIEEKHRTRIGALATIADLARLHRHPLLVAAALSMASPQVRALATAGGNLCNASPAADLAPPLLCLDAVLKTTERSIPIGEFFVGPGRTALRAGEILTEIEVPATPGRGTFLKFSPRRAMDLAIVSVACFRSNGTTRVALGAVAPVPLLVEPRDAVAGCAPIDDLRASAEYRRHLVGVLVRRALEATS